MRRFEKYCGSGALVKGEVASGGARPKGQVAVWVWGMLVFSGLA